MTNTIDPTDLALGQALLVLIARLNRWSTHNADTRLPLAQMRLLSLIDAHKAARISTLARADNCTQPGMTLQIQRLEEKTLVQRRADPDDGRAMLISLTEHGRSLLETVRQARAMAIAPVIGQLDPEARAGLRAALANLSHLLDTATALPQATSTPEN